MTQTTPFTVPLAVEPDGTPIVVDFTTTPHLAIFTPAGWGKTLIAKWLIHVATWTGACAALVDVIDSKRVAYRECATTPGVRVHCEIPAQVEAVSVLYNEMYRRYAAARDGVAALDSQVPRILVIDELAGFNAHAHRLLDSDARSTLVAQLLELLALGRDARVHVVATSPHPSGLTPLIRDLAVTAVIVAGYGPKSAAWRLLFGAAGAADVPRDVPWPSRTSLAYGSALRGVRFGRRTFGPADLTWRQA
jgi:ATPase family associated with various cellular activities (AAA)